MEYFVHICEEKYIKKNVCTTFLEAFYLMLEEGLEDELDKFDNE